MNLKDNEIKPRLAFCDLKVGSFDFYLVLILAL